ncbi:MAG: PKD domain-containing protein, partial [Candidatus Parabeggiatoa sp.]|nr:PKD domain-containing protein [Candidatus Parabeggiatoa sp.]
MTMSHFRKPLQNRFASGIQIVLLASSLCSVLPATIFAQEPCPPGSTTCQPPPDGGGNQPPQADFTVSPGQGPAPLTVTFDGNKSSDPDGEIRKYEWQLPDGQVFASGEKVSFTFKEPGEYEIELIVTDNKGSEAMTSKMVKVNSSTATPPPETANQPPFAKVVIEPKSGPAPLTVNLNNSGSYDPDGTSTSCEWQASNGQKSPSCNAQMTFNTAGTYPITLIVTDNQGLTNTAGGTVNVTEPEVQVQLPPTAQMSVTPKTGSAPLTVNLNNSGSSDPD